MLRGRKRKIDLTWQASILLVAMVFMALHKMKTQEQVYAGLRAYMIKQAKPSSAWYAGIAANPRERLFDDHNVSEQNGTWAFDTCDSDDDARSVEEALLRLGCQGGNGGGNQTTKSCYVYLTTSMTRE